MTTMATPPNVLPGRPAPPRVLEPIDRRAWAVLAVCNLAIFVVFLDTTIVNIAFPAIRADFGGSQASLSWVLNAYAIAFAALLVTAGRVADLKGRKRVFLAGLVIFAVTSAACGLAPNTGFLIGGRAIQAVGAAFLVPTSLALLLPSFPLSRRSLAVGLWGATGGLAAAVGPVVGALLIEHADWRWVFLVNLPLCAVTGVFANRLLRESTDPGARRLPDALSVVFAVAAVGLMSFGIVQSEVWGWTDPGVIGSFGVAAVLVPAFIHRSRHSAAPVVDLALFSDRTFSVATAATLLFGIAFYAGILSNVLFLTGVWRYSIVTAALAITPAPLLVATLGGVAGRLADRVGHRVIIVPGALCYAAGQLWYLVRVGEDPHYLTELLPGVLLVGVGIGLTFPTLSGASASSLPPARFGVGSAVNATVRQIGAVLGISALVALLGSADGLAGFQRGWTFIAIAAVGCSATALGLRRRTSATAA